MKRYQGFTLVELMVTLIILAIIAMMGAPSFRNIIIGTQIDSNLNLIRSSLVYARSEAVTKSVPVSACMTTDNESCVNAGDANWANSWIVWRDLDGDGVVDGDPVACADEVDDCVLRVYGPLEGGSTLVETNDNYFLTFSSRGQLLNPAANTIMFEMRIDNCEEGQERTIAVNRVGRVATAIGDGCDG